MSIVKDIRLIQDTLHLPADVVEYPSSGSKNIWEGFPESRRVIHVDTDSRAIDTLNELKDAEHITALEAYQADAATFDPGEPVDVLVQINSYVSYPNLIDHTYT